MVTIIFPTPPNIYTFALPCKTKNFWNYFHTFQNNLFKPPTILDILHFHTRLGDYQIYSSKIKFKQILKIFKISRLSLKGDKFSAKHKIFLQILLTNFWQCKIQNIFSNFIDQFLTVQNTKYFFKFYWPIFESTKHKIFIQILLTKV